MNDPLELAEWLRGVGSRLHSIESHLYDLAAILERPQGVADWPQGMAGERDKLSAMCGEFCQWIERGKI